MTGSEEGVAAQAQKNKIGLNVGTSSDIVSPNPSDQSENGQWQQWVQPFPDVLSKLPDLVGEFFLRYQQPLSTLGLILLLIVAVKVTLAILEAVNEIPLLAPFLELVGIAYTAWFIYRYLLKVESRQELTTEFKALKGQVVGKSSLDS